jgi:hypothetical protein
VNTLASVGTVAIEWRAQNAAGTQITLHDGFVPDVGWVSGSTTTTLRIAQPMAATLALTPIVVAACGRTFGHPTTLTVCLGDINCDSSVDFFDYLDFVDAFTSNSPTADFNTDGSIDFFDYIDFVDAFTTGC